MSGGLLTLAGLGVIALAMPEFSRLDMRKAIADSAHAAEPHAVTRAAASSAVEC